nr:EOG090X04O4 [Eulimnadia texana]
MRIATVAAVGHVNRLGLIFAAVLALTVATDENVVVKSAERTIDLTSQLVKITTRLAFQNNGKDSVKSLLYAVEPFAGAHLSFLKAQLTEGKDKLLKVSETKNEKYPGIRLWSIELKEPLAPGQSQKVRVDSVFFKAVNPHPAQISQREKQLVRYHGNSYVYVPYKVLSQTTKVTLSSSNVESFTKVKPSSQSDSSISYGPYENIAPLSLEDITIHYENNSPFLTLSSLTRHIEVSHWGNVAVEETVDMYHSGAKLKGSFSRFEYQREQSGVSSVKNFKTVLPALATDVYYRDEIGNISTSNLRETDDAVELELRPRFPLFGGWKTHYVVGYNVPSYEFVYSSGDQYVLKMKVVDHVYDNMYIEDALIRIVLPEGASDIELETPYPVERLADSLHFTYLDTRGRPVVQFRAKDLVESHIQDFQLRYRYSRLLMLQEPLLCVAAFFLLFLAVIVYVRLDFSLTTDEASESKLRAAGIAETVRERHEHRLSLYEKYEELLAKLKASKDANAFHAAVKTVLQDLKKETQAVADSLAQIKGDAALTERVNELQRLDEAFRQLLTNESQLVEKLVSGKVTKQQYVEQDGPIAKKKEEQREKMNQLLAAL